MDKKIYKQLCDTNYERRMELMSKKGMDYADNEDFISSFKRVGQVLEDLEIGKLAGPQQHVATMIVVKLDRIINISKSHKTPTNENLADSFADLSNYIDILYCLIYELYNM